MVADQDKKEIVPTPEKRLSDLEQDRPVERTENIVERKELSQDEKRVSAELRREVELMELDENLKKEAEKKAEKIEFLGEKEKVGHLLQMAREKGITFAIQVARKMNDPYLLDILHDTLAQEGFYKKIGQQNPNDDDDDNKK